MTARSKSVCPGWPVKPTYAVRCPTNCHVDHSIRFAECAMTDLYWDPFTPELRDDPYPLWKRMRDEAHVEIKDRSAYDPEGSGS